MSLISFYNQQQQLNNSSAYKNHQSGVGAIANTGDNTPSNGVAPSIQIQTIIMVKLGFYQKVIVLQ